MLLGISLLWAVSLWKALFVVSQNWSFPTALLENVGGCAFVVMQPDYMRRP